MLSSAGEAGVQVNSVHGCLRGWVFYDQSAQWPFASRRILILSVDSSDSTVITTDSAGGYRCCGLPAGNYTVWAADSSDFAPKQVIDAAGEYVYSDGGYEIPPYIRKKFRTVRVVGGDTTIATSTGLFYPRNMKGVAP